MSELKHKVESFLEVGAIPGIIHYGDSLWKKGWFGFNLIAHPGGKEYDEFTDLTPPKIKAKRGQIVTKDSSGIAFHGAGAIAANLTQVGELDTVETLQLIFNADKNAKGIVLATKDGYIVGWVDRSDVPNIQ